MSKEYLNGIPDNSKSEKPKGFASNKNTILLSVLIVLVLAVITFIVIASLKPNDKGEDRNETQNLNSSVSETIQETASVSQTETITLTTVNACPICSESDFENKDGNGYYTCRACGTKWKEEGDKIMVIQNGETTEISVTTTSERSNAAQTVTTASRTTTTRPTTTTRIITSSSTTITVGPSGTHPAYGYTKDFYYVSKETNLFKNPDSASEVVATLHEDDLVYIERINAPWGYTSDSGGGWVNLFHVRPAERVATAPDSPVVIR